MLGSTKLRSLMLALAVASGAAASVGCSHAAGAASSPTAHSITVVGHGEAHARPDVARVTLGVETRAATVEEANRVTNQRIAAVIAAVRAVGIPEKDVQTSNYSIYFERFHPEHPPMPYGVPQAAMGMAADAVASAPAAAPAAPPRTAGGSKGSPAASPPPSAASAATPPPTAGPPGVYRVANTVTITIRDMAKVAQVLDAAVGTGANEVHGVSFDLDAREPHEAKVREEAVADARTRAETLARLHGKKLGPVLAISEVVTDVARPMFAPMAMSRDAAAGGAQIAPGEVTVSGQLQVVYAFED
jgi:uncharacterized protein YggE